MPGARVHPRRGRSVIETARDVLRRPDQAARSLACAIVTSRAAWPLWPPLRHHG